MNLLWLSLGNYGPGNGKNEEMGRRSLTRHCQHREHAGGFGL